MLRALLMASLFTVPFLGGCSLVPFGHKERAVPQNPPEQHKPAGAGLKIAVDVVMAQLRKAEDGDLQAVQGAAPQIYQLAAALASPAQPSTTPVTIPPAVPHNVTLPDAATATPATHPPPVTLASFTPAPAAPPPVLPLPHARSLMYAVHLGSYRSTTRASLGFAELAGKAPKLAALQARVEKVDLGPGKGVYERLKAGPLASRADAEALCGALHNIGLYCSPADFTGRTPG